MSKDTEQNLEEISTENTEQIQTVALAPSSPSIRTIVRVVIVTLVILYGVNLLNYLFTSLTFFLFLLVISIFLAYLLEPLVKLIRHPFKVRNLDKLMPRPLAIVVSYLLVFGVLAIAISYLAPIISTQVKEFAANLPNYANAVQARVKSLSNRYNQLMIPEDVQAEINKKVGESIQYLGGTVAGFVSGFALNLITYLPWILLIPVLSFFFLKDANLFRLMFLKAFPSGRWRARADSLLTDVNKTLAAYTRAQLISCFLIGLLCTLGFSIIGLDYPVLLGILAGVFEFVPLLGPLTLGVIATLVALFSDNPTNAIWTAAFLIILRLVHDYFTYPRIVRDGIHLHPFAIILSVLAGEQLAGIPGVFLSIPIVAIVTVLYKHILEHSGKKGLLEDVFETDEQVVEKNVAIEINDPKETKNPKS